jgi:hypothetical protein
MKSKDINYNEQKPNGSPMRPSREFQERMRLLRLKGMNELHEKRMKEYWEKKNQRKVLT